MGVLTHLSSFFEAFKAIAFPGLSLYPEYRGNTKPPPLIRPSRRSFRRTGECNTCAERRQDLSLACLQLQ